MEEEKRKFRSISDLSLIDDYLFGLFILILNQIVDKFAKRLRLVQGKPPQLYAI